MVDDHPGVVVAEEGLVNLQTGQLATLDRQLEPTQLQGFPIQQLFAGVDRARPEVVQARLPSQLQGQTRAGQPHINVALVAQVGTHQVEVQKGGHVGFEGVQGQSLQTQPPF